MKNNSTTPFCKFSADAALFASTPLENLFIQEYMLNAPGNFVKVYIYALMQCNYPTTAERSPEKFSISLGMSHVEVEKAMLYWQKKGLIRKNNPDSYEFCNVRSSIFDGRVILNEEQLYDHTSLSNRIKEIAQDREISPKEYEMLYDLVDVDNFEEEAVAFLFQHAINIYGKKLKQNQLASMAKEWKQKNIKTNKEAREEVLGHELKNSPANKILINLGILYRNVSEAENNLYHKWTEQWNFSQNAIIQATNNMTGTANPNFKYLDKVLKTLSEKGNTTTHKIISISENQNEIDAKIQKIIYRLGIPGRITDSRRQLYKNWTENYKLSDQSILMICDELSTSEGGYASFRSAESLISSYVRRGIVSTDLIKKEQDNSNNCVWILNKLGLNRQPNEIEKVKLLGWMKKMPRDVIELAISYAYRMKQPMSYLIHVLDDWQKLGISSITEAEARNKNRFEKSNTNNHSNTNLPKISSINAEKSRSYSEMDLNDIINDLN